MRPILYSLKVNRFISYKKFCNVFYFGHKYLLEAGSASNSRYKYIKLNDNSINDLHSEDYIFWIDNVGEYICCKKNFACLFDNSIINKYLKVKEIRNALGK